MNRNDIQAYMTQKVRSANSAIEFHSKRLTWLKEEGQILWITEQDLLEKHHKDGYADAIRELQRAEHWPIIERIGLRLHEGKSVALYCFCAPKRCHCMSIKKHAEIKAAKLRDPMNPFVPNR